MYLRLDLQLEKLHNILSAPKSFVSSHARSFLFSLNIVFRDRIDRGLYRLRSAGKWLTHFKKHIGIS